MAHRCLCGFQKAHFLFFLFFSFFLFIFCFSRPNESVSPESRYIIDIPGKRESVLYLWYATILHQCCSKGNRAWTGKKRIHPTSVPPVCSFAQVVPLLACLALIWTRIRLATDYAGFARCINCHFPNPFFGFYRILPNDCVQPPWIFHRDTNECFDIWLAWE